MTGDSDLKKLVTETTDSVEKLKETMQGELVKSKDDLNALEIKLIGMISQPTDFEAKFDALKQS